MTNFSNFFDKTFQSPASAVIFMSGQGDNARKLLKDSIQNNSGNYQIKAIVTDNPQSNAQKIGDEFSIPVIIQDIKAFYKAHGFDSIRLSSPEAFDLRKAWSREVVEAIKDFSVDFGLMAGFKPLCDLMSYFPCLNIHPGDLSYCEDGKRVLTGLHTEPIEKAIIRGFTTLRSSVIVTEPLASDGGNVDGGFILGISDEVKIDFLDYTVEELEVVALNREGKKPVGGWNDSLSDVADHNLNRLKKHGDLQLYSKVVEDFAAGRFAYSGNTLLYRLENKLPISTIIYGESFKEIIFSID